MTSIYKQSGPGSASSSQLRGKAASPPISDASAASSSQGPQMAREQMALSQAGRTATEAAAGRAPLDVKQTAALALAAMEGTTDRATSIRSGLAALNVIAQKTENVADQGTANLAAKVALSAIEVIKPQDRSQVYDMTQATLELLAGGHDSSNWHLAKLCQKLIDKTDHLLYFQEGDSQNSAAKGQAMIATMAVLSPDPFVRDLAYRAQMAMKDARPSPEVARAMEIQDIANDYFFAISNLSTESQDEISRNFDINVSRDHTRSLERMSGMDY